MCAVYSAIREFLSDEKISLQNWIQYAIKHLGIVVRDDYLASLGWELVRADDGTHKLRRTAARVVESSLQPMNGLGLFMSCLNDGLPVANPLPIMGKLSDLSSDVICVNTRPGDSARPTNTTITTTTTTMQGFREFAKSHPQLAMSALFQVPVAHPVIAQGVTVHHIIPAASDPATNRSGFVVQDNDPELDAMLDRILRGDGSGNPASQALPGPQLFGMGMDMGNGTQGKPRTLLDTTNIGYSRSQS